jgi:hypothetical protein
MTPPVITAKVSEHCVSIFSTVRRVSKIIFKVGLVVVFKVKKTANKKDYANNRTENRKKV